MSMATLKTDKKTKRLQILGSLGGQLQEKTVTPTTEQQIVTPDEECYGLSKVIVDGMPDAELVSFSSEQLETDSLYAIGHNWFADVVGLVQRMAGMAAKLTPADIIYWLGRVKFIPQGWATSEFTLDFDSGASGVLPVVVKGTASSEFTLNFESSAVGALQEG